MSVATENTFKFKPHYIYKNKETEPNTNCILIYLNKLLFARFYFKFTCHVFDEKNIHIPFLVGDSISWWEIQFKFFQFSSVHASTFFSFFCK